MNTEQIDTLLTEVKTRVERLHREYVRRRTGTGKLYQKIGTMFYNPADVSIREANAAVVLADCDIARDALNNSVNANVDMDPLRAMAAERSSRLGVQAARLIIAVNEINKGPVPVAFTSGRYEASRSTWSRCPVSFHAIWPIGTPEWQHRALQMALQLYSHVGGKGSGASSCKNNDTDLDDNPDAQAFIRRENLAKPSTFTSCHPTAIGLQLLIGRPKTEQAVIGDGTAETRRDAINLAISCINALNRLMVVQIAGQGPQDGHSFNFITNYDGTVSSCEAWAGESETATLAYQWQKHPERHRMGKHAVCEHLRMLLDDDPDVRDQGYRYLTIAYGSGTNSYQFEYEYTDPPEVKPRRTRRAARDQHRLTCRARELRPYPRVLSLLNARYDKIKAWNNDELF